MNFADYKDKFEGRRAWILGRGPSLEALPLIKIPENDLVIGINESCRVYKCDFVFAHDEVTIPYITDTDAIMILEYRFKYLLYSEHIKRTVFYNKYQYGFDNDFDTLTGYSKDEMVANEMLIGLYGTIHSAIHFCWYAGIQELILVGVDPEQDGKYHSSQDQFSGYEGESYHIYIHIGTIQMIRKLNLKVKRIILKEER